MTRNPGFNFRLFGFPVQVHFSFFLIALLLGFSFNNLLLLVLWVAIVFFSILLHEMGHAVVANAYGRNPYIELYTMGGQTVSTRYTALSYPKEIFLSFAGPLAGFLMGGLLFLVLRLVSVPDNLYVNFLFSQLLWVNIGWGLINLIPILPLDGGHIMRDLYHWLKNPRDERTPLIISMVFGVLAVIVFLVVFRSLYMAFLAGWLTFNNYQSISHPHY